MRDRIGVFAVAILCCATACAHDIITTKLTYTREISRIFERRCSACHGEGAKISLNSYQSVRPWAVDIKEQVLSRSMPPWGAVKGFGNLDSDEGLTQEEILIIASWVVGGAPQGDPSVLPKEPPKSIAISVVRAGGEITIDTRTTLQQAIEAVGIRPTPDARVASARVIAHLPDGRIQPLIWLYGFDPKLHRTFMFREPLPLEKGTVIESSAPVLFALETIAPILTTATGPSRAR